MDAKRMILPILERDFGSEGEGAVQCHERPAGRPFLESVFVNRPSQNSVWQGASRKRSELRDREGTQPRGILTGSGNADERSEQELKPKKQYRLAKRLSRTSLPLSTNTKTMSEKLEQCRNRLREEVRTTEANLAKAGHHLTSAIETGADALEVCEKNALAKCESQREQASQAGERIKQFLEETKHTAVTKFEDWKTDREIDQLEMHADKTEQQAVDAIVVAAFAILEAEVAIVEALKARKIAIEVAG
jgi:hypothetical protein